MKPQITIIKTDVLPTRKTFTWDYSFEELGYLFEQILDGTRENGEIFYLCDGRLYESYETETLDCTQALAEKIYELCEDMDWEDYEETKDAEIAILVKELNKAKEYGLGELIGCLELALLN